MGKALTYMILIMGIVITMSFFGIGDTSTSQLLRVISYDDPANVRSLDLVVLVFGAAGVLALLSTAGAVVAGLIFRQSASDILLASFVSLLTGWMIGDLYMISTHFTSIGDNFTWLGIAVKALIFVLIGGLIISMISFWRGTD